MAKKRSRLVLPHKAYKLLCLNVHERDGWKCQIPHCGRRENLHCHHIVFRSQGGDDAGWNLLTVCNDCHEAIHDRYIWIKPKDGAINADKKQYVIEFLPNWNPRKKRL